jgi:formate--tetrahydrofolate ligase
VTFLPQAKKQLATLKALGFDSLPVCMAKTQYSFSDDQTKLGAPTGFTVTVKNVRVSAGAGFVVVLTGDIMTMPGLPKVPAAERIDVDESGKITGLF